MPAGAVAAAAVPAAGPGFQDTIALLYGYQPAEQRVVGMEVLESRETPGLGDKIFKDAEFVAEFDAPDADREERLEVLETDAERARFEADMDQIRQNLVSLQGRIGANGASLEKIDRLIAMSDLVAAADELSGRVRVIACLDRMPNLLYSEQPEGSTIAIGTELNLINRLVHEHPNKKILVLSGETCPVCANMYRTTLNDLAYCLENHQDIKPITVPDDIRADALIALERMLEVH